MIDYYKWSKRFPELVPHCDSGAFSIWLDDAMIEMGSDNGRWINVYDIAQSYYIAHLVALSRIRQESDGSAIYPIKATEVERVEVEYAVSPASLNKLDNFTLTAYGQEYLRWRRMAFAGVRVAR